jgi:hypothetical protein
MKYPQCYIFLNEKTQFPPLSTLQAWFKAGTEIYVKGLSRDSKVLDNRITLLEELHRHAWKKSDYQMKCIVISDTIVSSTFLIAHRSDLIKVYWIDSPEHAKEIKQVSKHIRMSMSLTHSICSVEKNYSSLSEYIYNKTGSMLVGDAEIQRFFMGRNWGTISEAEIHIRRIAKSETRAGVLRRIDLEENSVVD